MAMRLTTTSTCLLAAALAFSVAACGGSSDGPSGDSSRVLEAQAGPISMRRLTSEQYRRSVHDVLGNHIVVPSRLDPVARREGLVAVGSSFGSVSASGFEKYEAAATVIAEQALDIAHRANLVPCEPASTSGSDEGCAREFARVIGRRLFRRPLTDEELEERVSIANESAQVLGDFYAGLELSLASLLVSPHFLFHVQTAEQDPDDATKLRLTGASLASRLSFFLVNSTPDEALQAAGEDGSLLDNAVLSEHVDRLVESESIDTGLRSFFTDLYDLKKFDDGVVRKDSALFPAYNEAVATDAKEQTLRTISEHLREGRDARDLFTTRETVMSRALGPIYDVRVAATEGFEPHAFDDAVPRAGILSHVSLLALYSHAGRSSATLRGKFVREVLLCQIIPEPPANVDFSIVENTTGDLLTARERLSAHNTNNACAGCHSLMDPIGLALENFDAIGSFRETENGATIDPSGVLDGVAFDDAEGLGQALREHPNLGPCLTRNVFRYAVGREPTLEEQPFLDALEDRFARSEHRVPDLLRDIITSEAFRTTSGPRVAEGAAQ
jgi:hypothetical protein